jgi:hypothetical protein
MAVGCDQRRAGVEAEVRIAHHQRVVAKPPVVERIGDDHQGAVLDRPGAERDTPRRFLHRHADPRLEPLAVLVHQRDEGHGRAADLRREQGEIVEGPLGLGIQDAVAGQRGQTLGFAGAHHAPPLEWGFNPTPDGPGSRSV